MYEQEYGVCPACGHVPGEPAKEPYYIYPGQTLNNRYIVGQVLGAGGFGITYKVWDTRLETVLAIKEYYPSGLVNRAPGSKEVLLFTRNRKEEYDHWLTRFLDEAKSMAKFSTHRNIINVFEYFEENATAYIVMEYLDGITLSAFLKTSVLDLRTSLDIIGHVCSALQDIHASGIVHRDISPDNIFICSNNVIKLIDFGAARFYPNEDRQMTIILKPGFAPPEQYESVNLQGPWTDIYALGSTLYLMVTGDKPEESTNRRIEDTLPPPAEINPGVPEQISNTIMKAMAIDRHMRFLSVADFRKALNNEKKVLPVAKEKKRRKQKRLATVFASLIVILAAAAIVWMNIQGQKVRDADITLWYSYSSEAEAAMMDEAISLVIGDFNKAIPNVSIEVKAFPDEIYAAELLAAAREGRMPTLFRSTGLPPAVMEYAMDLSPALEQLETSDYCFMENYNYYFPDRDRVPLGFYAPVIYLNKTLYDRGEDSISDIAALMDSATMDTGGLVVEEGKAAAYVDVYGPYIYAAEQEGAKALFLLDGASAYLSDTSDYFEIRDEMAGFYRLLRVDSRIVPGTLTDMWSISSAPENELAAAEILLRFMLGDKAQNHLYMRARGGVLPINRNLLNMYCEIYNDFDGFFINLENYVMS